MLKIQEYLRSGKTVDNLKTELGINNVRHPTLPLIALRYDQIESPKADPIVRECRGIVLEDGTFNLVAAVMPRFFNFGEQPELFSDFDWSDFRCDEKCDGSLIILFYYKDKWRVNTSGSFGLGECNFSGKTWGELFWSTFGKDKKILDEFKHLTLIFELWTPFNKVVRTYPTSKVWLLGAFEPNPLMGDPECRELRAKTVDHLALELGLSRPESYKLKSIDEIMSLLKEKEISDKTFEGFVVRDNNNIRAKIKSATYLAIHHLLDNQNLFNPSRQVTLVLAGETGELFAVLKELMDSTPELKARIELTKTEVESEWQKLKKVWEDSYQIDNQKAFALAIQGKTKFTNILFTVRKKFGKMQTIEDIKRQWQDSADLITKVLYG